MDTLIEHWTARISEAASAGGKLAIRGGGSKSFYGGPENGEALDVGGYRGIVAYEPTELVVTARAGTPLAELAATLAEKGSGWRSSRRISGRRRPSAACSPAACRGRAGRRWGRCAISFWASNC
jgi:hypothetical protein